LNINTAKKSIIDQREIGLDTKDFHTALISMFREDINVVLIGEMRGSIRFLLPSLPPKPVTWFFQPCTPTMPLKPSIVSSTHSRPISKAKSVCSLADQLTGIFSQRLIPRISGGLIPAYELLINNSAVANLIRERRTHEINTVIETGSQLGMIDMNRSLAELVRAGEITIENAYRYSLNPKDFGKIDFRAAQI
jgi:twitching motility protein PilT